MLGMIFLLIVSLGNTAFAQDPTEKVELTVDIELKDGHFERSNYNDPTTVVVDYTLEGATKQKIVSSDSTFEVDKDKDVTLTAVPGTYDEFVKWNDDLSLTETTHKIDLISEATTVKTEFDFQKLIVTEVDAWTYEWDDDKDSSTNLAEEETIENGVPGGKMEIEIEVLNNFPDKDEFEDYEIDDIEIEVKIRDIDEDSDLDDTVEMSSLDITDDDKEPVQFKIPLESKEDDYNVEIIVTGKNEKTKDKYKSTRKQALEVKKESNDVRIYKNDLIPGSVICSRKGIEHEIGVINIGDRNEDDVEVVATSVALGINFRDSFDLDKGDFNDDIKQTVSYRFDVAEDLGPGIYPIDVKVIFEEGDDQITDKEADKAVERAEIAVDECTVTTTTTLPAVVGDVDDVVDLIMPPVTGDTTVEPTTTTVPEEDTTVEEEGLFSNTAFVAVLIGAEVLVALLVIILIVGLTRRR